MLHVNFDNAHLGQKKHTFSVASSFIRLPHLEITLQHLLVALHTVLQTIINPAAPWQLFWSQISRKAAKKKSRSCSQEADSRWLRVCAPGVTHKAWWEEKHPPLAVRPSVAPKCERFKTLLRINSSLKINKYHPALKRLPRARLDYPQCPIMSWVMLL